MSPVQGEIGVDIVIESPEIPAIRIMAAPAILSEGFLVRIVRRMTRAAGGVLLLECVVAMARLAGRDRMQPEQGKFRQIMVE